MLRTVYYVVGIVVMIVVLLHVFLGSKKRTSGKYMDCQNCAHMYKRTHLGAYYCSSNPYDGFLLRPRHCDRFKKKGGGEDG